ncbi:MAG TPA: glycosyltransferase family 39 protein, partial [Polyangiaceae bacterium]|nr:glycosyltransferase family 39 protein [Polyangiaceae bacterium]
DDVWVTRIVLVFLVSQCVWIGWDQPGALGWENDGVAPRDFFTGVADNLLPGHGHRYPLFHNALLLALCLPVLAIAAICALITGVPVVSAVLSVPSMTAVSLLCKLFHVALNGAMLLLLARLARQLFGETAARACVLFATVSLTIGYYGRVSNLDGPYMFWSVLALLLSMRVMDRGELGDYRLLGFSIAASVATKDQAYAGYVLATPVYLVLLPAFRPGFFAAGRGHFRALLSTCASALLSYAVLSGAVFNPTGLWTRVALLTGPNSQKWREYARTSAGVLLNVEDLWRAQSAFFWHWSLVALAWAGVVLALFAPATARERWLRALPFAFAVSSVLMFVIPVARCEHRFVLPLGVWLCIYGGASIAWLARCRVQIVGRSFLLAAGLGWLASLWQCVELGLTQLGDARHGVRAALARLPAGSVVETYGPPVYQPQFDFSAASPYRVERVGKEPPRARSRMLHVNEVVDDYVNVSRRQPAAVLVPEGFARWFLAREFRPGEAPSVR